MKANRVEHYQRIHPWENFFLDSALYSVGQALGIAYEEGFQPVAAVTGDLFAYLYSREKYCDSGLTNSFFRPESVEEVYAMYGYACRYLSREEIRADFAAAMALIRTSVDRGIPVLAWGCGGVRTKRGETYDPLPEGSLIGGYEEDELLYVNLYPGEDRLAETSAGGRPGVDQWGYTALYAKEALATTYGVFLVGDRMVPTPEREVCRRAVLSIPELLTRKPENGYTFGMQAFVQWAETLREDAHWAEPDSAQRNCWDKHCHAYCSLCTSIGVGDGKGVVGYLEKAAQLLPDMPEIAAILPLYRELRRLNQAIWDYQGGFMPPSDQMAQREYREAIAGILERMSEVCARIAAVFY